MIGFAGTEIPTVKANRLLLSNTSVIGAATHEFWARNPDHPRQQWDDLLPLLESGRLDPVIGPVLALDQAAVANRMLDERRATGKVLVRVRLPAGTRSHERTEEQHARHHPRFRDR